MPLGPEYRVGTSSRDGVTTTTLRTFRGEEVDYVDPPSTGAV